MSEMLITLRSTLFSNALLVLPLALLVMLTARFVRHPAIAWALWGLVLIKFVTPAVVPLPIEVVQSNPQSSRLSPRDEAPQVAAPSVPNMPPVSLGAYHAERDGYFEPSLAPQPDVVEAHEIASVAFSPLFDSKDDSTVGRLSESSRHEPPHTETVPLVELPPHDSESRATVVLPTPLTEHPRTSAQSASSAVYFNFNWHRALWIVWLAGTLLTATIALWRITRFRKLLQAATPADAQIIAIAQGLAADLGLRTLPDIRLTAGRVPPLLFAGLFHTTVLLPRELLASLDDESRRTLLAHELAHLARRDHLVRWIELAVRCLYWWHPVAWWAGRKLREAEEQCCDARVVRLLPDSAAAYAHTILTTVDYLTAGTRPIPTLATGLQPVRRSVRPLHRRLTMIVEKPAPRTSWLSRLLVLTLAACILPVALTGATEEDAKAEARTADENATESETPAVPTKAKSYSFYVGTAESQGPVPIAYDFEVQETGTNPATKLAASKEENPGPSQRPGAASSQYEEITVEVREYPMPAAVAAGFQHLFKSMESDFSVLETSLVRADARSAPMMGMGSDAPSTLRVIAPLEVQTAVGEFVEGMRKASASGLKADRLTLTRGTYSGPSLDTMGGLELVLNAYQSTQQITPLVVKSKGGKLTITTYRPVHEHIARLVAFLKKHERLGSDDHTVSEPTPFDIPMQPTVSQEFSASPATPGQPIVPQEFEVPRTTSTQPAASREVLELDLRIAESEVRVAEAGLANVQGLVKKGVVPKLNLGPAEVKLLKAQRTVKQLQALLVEDKSHMPSNLFEPPTSPASNEKNSDTSLNENQQFIWKVLGIRLEPQPEEKLEPARKEIPLRPMQVVAVKPAGPADDAGVRVGDYLMGMEGHAAYSDAELTKALKEVGAGRVPFSLIRETRHIYAYIRLDPYRTGKLPSPTPEQEAARKQQNDAAEEWLLKTAGELVATVDLSKPRLDAVAEIIAELKRREQSASRDEAGTLALMRGVFELIEADLQAHSQQPPDPEATKQSRINVVRELSKWGVAAKTLDESNDFLILFTNYLAQAASGYEAEKVKIKDSINETPQPATPGTPEIQPADPTSDVSQTGEDAKLLERLDAIDKGLLTFGPTSLALLMSPIDPAQIPYSLNGTKRLGTDRYVMSLLCREAELVRQHGPEHPEVRKLQQALVILRVAELEEMGKLPRRVFDGWGSNASSSSVLYSYKMCLQLEAGIEPVLKMIDDAPADGDRMELIDAVLVHLVNAQKRRDIGNEADSRMVGFFTLVKEEASLRAKLGKDDPRIRELRDKILLELKQAGFEPTGDDTDIDLFEFSTSKLRERLALAREQKEKNFKQLLRLFPGLAAERVDPADPS